MIKPTFVNNRREIIMKYEIKSIIEDLTIIIETAYISDLPLISNQVSRQVIDTQEQAIKEALIKLGWRPPTEP